MNISANVVGSTVATSVYVGTTRTAQCKAKQVNHNSITIRM